MRNVSDSVSPLAMMKRDTDIAAETRTSAARREIAGGAVHASGWLGAEHADADWAVRPPSGAAGGCGCAATTRGLPVLHDPGAHYT